MEAKPGQAKRQMKQQTIFFLNARYFYWTRYLFRIGVLISDILILINSLQTRWHSQKWKPTADTLNILDDRPYIIKLKCNRKMSRWPFHLDIWLQKLQYMQRLDNCQKTYEDLGKSKMSHEWYNSPIKNLEKNEN